MGDADRARYRREALLAAGRHLHVYVLMDIGRAASSGGEAIRTGRFTAMMEEQLDRSIRPGGSDGLAGQRNF